MKKLIFTLIFVMLMGFSFISCNKHDFETKNYSTIAKEQFDAKFTQTFGIPASNQDWGFDESIKVFDFTQAITRSHDVNRNQWSGKYVIPANVTSEEEQAVMNKLAEGNGNRDKNLTIPYTNFFVYHVHKGTDTYNDHNGSNIGVASDKMNHLQCGSGTVGENGVQSGFWEHVNDFNSGQQTANWWTIEGATVMLESSSANFAYHNSTDSKYHDTYTVIDGATIGYPGFYYVCFDFFANGDIEQPSNKNMGVDRNYNYTDWIIRVSPCEFDMTNGVRIIAEDLGASESDFDYNDVVFDAKVAIENPADRNYQNTYVAYIVLRAAGGTLPLTVGGKEVHEAFNVPTSTMVNTGLYTANSVSFKMYLGDVDYSNKKSGAELVKSIPVIVKKNNDVYELEVETGKAPEKIAVSTNFEWVSERTPIYKVYPLFKNWVQDKSIIWY